MRIENISNLYNKKIRDVDIGECIMYQGELCMKINPGGLHSELSHTMNTYPNLIINLEKNCLNALVNSSTVQKVNAKIVIE